MPRTPNSPPEIADHHLVLQHQRRGGAGLALSGSPFLTVHSDLAGLGVERDERRVGLMQEDLAVAIGERRD